MVVWNQWVEQAKEIPDFGDDEYPNMACVESGHVSSPMILLAGTAFEASQILQEKPPPSKKTKPAATTSQKDENGDISWQLEKLRYVKVREFRGKVFVDIREYYESDGDLKPGKKGISLSAQQWRKLKDLVPEIDQALKEK